MKTTPELCDQHGWYLDCPECLHHVIPASDYEQPTMTPLWDVKARDICINCGIHVVSVLYQDEIVAERDFSKELVFPTARFKTSLSKTKPAPVVTQKPLLAPVQSDIVEDDEDEWEDL